MRPPDGIPIKEKTMKQLFQCLSAAVAVAALSTQVPALAKADFASKDEAIAMVKKGVAFVKANGKDKGYAEITNKKGTFVDRDLYLVVYGMDGTVLAHGANEKQVGHNLIDLKDIDGKLFVKERVELAQKQPTFWQEYKFTDPVTRKIEPKEMYCERLDDTIVCGGIYKH
jgi:signal transduction histidine kinase